MPVINNDFKNGKGPITNRGHRRCRLIKKVDLSPSEEIENTGCDGSRKRFSRGLKKQTKEN